MYNNILHKVFSLLVVITVLLPMSMQFAHAFESHSHETCKEKNIQHLHANEVECEFDHYLFKTTGSLSTNWQRIQNAPVNTTPITHTTNKLRLTSLFPTLSRGSPLAII